MLEGSFSVVSKPFIASSRKDSLYKMFGPDSKYMFALYMYSDKILIHRPGAEVAQNAPPGAALLPVPLGGGRAGGELCVFAPKSRVFQRSEIRWVLLISYIFGERVQNFKFV